MATDNQTLVNSSSGIPPREGVTTAVEFTSDRILTILTLSLFIPCIIAGNSLVIAAVLRFRPLRTVTNVFVTSLAVTDALVGMLCLPIYMAYMIKGHVWFHFNHPDLQQAWKGIDQITGVTLIVHLMGISIDRYTCIHYPFTYRKIMSSRKSGIMIAFGWVYGILFYALRFISSLDPTTRTLVVTVLGYLVPLCVTIAAYVSIARVAGKQVRRIKGLQNHNKSTLASFIKEVKAAGVLAGVVCAFILCWSGTFIMNLKFAICRRCSGCDCALPTFKVINAVKMLQYSSSLLDPLIYASLNKDFRKAIKKIVCGRSRSSGRLMSGTSSVNTRSMRFTQDSASYEEMKMQEKTS
ncbi:dopamine receptor 2-like [Dendronephthya gigantea]|uniref:dopamine receptor 2-like n=1 Tax=Dendronephthya gigantea TaxID=151771 RepID=UPI001069BCF9|nr:dopamine receptor 2-like [Dendronephthya gigantea]XP_028391538.1 dopamine receptor 2-like [Dendronephthya gigantea]